MTEPQLAIAKSSAQLTDTLVDDFDQVEFPHQVTMRGQPALDVEAVGLVRDHAHHAHPPDRKLTDRAVADVVVW